MKKTFFAFLLAALIAVSVYGGIYNIEPNGFSQEAIYNFLQNVVTNCNTFIFPVETTSYPNFHYHVASSPYWDVGDSFTFSKTGYLYQYTAADELNATATVQGLQKACMYLFSTDTAGTFTVTKGTEVAYTATPGIPSLPSGNIPFGLIKVVVSNTAVASFTLGTSAYNYDAGTTLTTYNLRNMPSGASAMTSLSLTNFD